MLRTHALLTPADIYQLTVAYQVFGTLLFHVIGRLGGLAS